ncbi:hypothetical protein J2T09_000091 [Neorhizobium huautlense]|uniref:Uncharacterized protein n=1 Tax=Neorhizobium huautlense TaxID=67774 RepID=A0ABT9PLL3_9HYPH|nr:hypothetical protein [Neorhizobium huautlense]
MLSVILGNRLLAPAEGRVRENVGGGGALETPKSRTFRPLLQRAESRADNSYDHPDLGRPKICHDGGITGFYGGKEESNIPSRLFLFSGE